MIESMEEVSLRPNFSLVICTYKRPDSLRRLLSSVATQKLYPNEILIIDGSPETETEEMLSGSNFRHLKYYKVKEEDRGLTRQRNIGVQRVSRECEIICFLDDDIILSSSYFEKLIETYGEFPDALGASGYITNEIEWQRTELEKDPSPGRFYFDGWHRTEGSRFSLRRKFGLAPDKPPGIMPDFSHGYSTAFLPPSGRTYEVELMMGGLASYKVEIFKKLKFSNFFEKYGLYEDADFSLRVSKLGKLYVNTAARLEHHHDPAGRPNMFYYGKMVVRNGWYVWRIKIERPTPKAKFKWHTTALLLTFIRFGNIFTRKNKSAAFQESFGRIIGWLSLWIKSPSQKEYE